MFEKIRDLSKDLAVYGIGDVAVSVVNFLLLPLYVRYLSPQDYGVLGLLGSVEVIAKVFFRWGLDGSFMRFFYDCETPSARQRLASTIFFFLLALNGLLLAASLVWASALARYLFGSEAYLNALRLTLLNTFIIGFTFFPFHVLRMEKRSVEFGAMTLTRSASTVLLRIALIVGLGFGVMGVVIADLLVTSAVMLLLLRRFAPLIRPAFSMSVLHDALRFGLPRVPHAAAQQVIAVGDKFILTMFVPLGQVGVYAMGVSFGLTEKLFLSAFEYAWAPFYYANAREPDARRIFSSVTTYGVAILALLTAGLSAIGRDLLLAVVGRDYGGAAAVVTWTAVGVMLQGIYLLTSIGLNLTKRTEFYPMATITAAGVNIGMNFLLVPRFGFIGAAWANAIAYGVQAAVAFGFAQRFYRISYDVPRLSRIAGAAIAAWLAAAGIPDMHPVLGVVLRGTTVVVVFCALLWVSGFLKPGELQRLSARRPAQVAPPVMGSAEITELGGEIVATELPDAASAPPPRAGRERG